MAVSQGKIVVIAVQMLWLMDHRPFRAQAHEATV